MRTTLAAGLAFIISLCLPAASMAQHGHPLAGIWLGDWGSATARSDVVLELYWKDTTLSGNINPGFPDEATIDVGELDPANWTVHLEAMSKDEAGSPVRVVIDGQIENLGSAKRTLSGTWKRGAATGDFKLTRE
jgi:hypothetical protein